MILLFFLIKSKILLKNELISKFLFKFIMNNIRCQFQLKSMFIILLININLFISIMII